MTDDRLPTGLWVDAHLRKLSAAAIPAYVVNRGNHASGTVIVKIVMRGAGCRLLSQMRDINGEMGWMSVFEETAVEEPRADAYIRRSLSRDPDLWVIEVEDASGANPFDGKIF